MYPKALASLRKVPVYVIVIKVATPSVNSSAKFGVIDFSRSNKTTVVRSKNFGCDSNLFVSIVLQFLVHRCFVFVKLKIALI